MSDLDDLDEIYQMTRLDTGIRSGRGQTSLKNVSKNRGWTIASQRGQRRNAFTRKITLPGSHSEDNQ